MASKSSVDAKPLRGLSFLAKLPRLPLYLTLCVALTITVFSVNQPHHLRRLSTSISSSSAWNKFNSKTPHEYGERRSTGRIRLTEAPRTNVWKELSEDDIDHVLATISSFGAEAGVPAKGQITFVERLMPNKSSVLPLLESSSVDLSAWARVVVTQRSEWGGKDGGISEWMVGPLSSASEARVLPLSYIYNSGRNFIQRPIPDLFMVLPWFNKVVNGPLRDMMSDLLEEIPDFSSMTKVPGLMTLSSPSTSSNAVSPIVEGWLTVHAFGYLGIRDAFSLLPQGMYAHLSVQGLEEADWKIAEWYYNGVLYNSTRSFHDAWKEGRVLKSLPNKDGDWTNAEPKDHGIQDRDVLPPILVQPYGPRVSVDEKENYVKWLDWEFYLSFSQVTSLTLFDIRFRGERIIYEVGMQEAMAHYAGSSPASTGQIFFDTLFGFGLSAFALVPGYDCPAYATFLPVSFWREGDMHTRENAICVFEAVSDHPLQRHTTRGKVTVSRNSYLVVRTVSTVGNYDYTISYFLYLDGSVEVKVHASGYIFTDYITLEAMRKDLATRGETQISEYGYRIHDVVVSSMHTHEIIFKADLDVAGTQNTLYKVEIEPMTRQYSFESEPRNTMHLVHSPVKEESGLDWIKNSQGIYVVLNNASTNAWGEKRGYKIVPGTGMGTPPHLVIKNSTAGGQAAAWAYHDLWVLKQHDHEPRAASEWNAWEIADPLIDFDKFVDGEGTVQEDLVLYFNLGVHHISNSADIPNTLMHWSGTSVMFVPHNYHDRDPSRDSAQGLRLKLGKQKTEEVKHFGARYQNDIHIKKGDVDPSFEEYKPPTFGIGALSHNASFN